MCCLQGEFLLRFLKTFIRDSLGLMAEQYFQPFLMA
ncbi:hypothetical protein Gorai_003457 [Gossypium raimondii]|uniref:Uncharacterized protein n=1 Tax=Gossypium raimondii TaxID=29730 RepID=A0A7J8QP03_GOSRA|nr:hypothetical protein [Gossypium raimondii]